MGDDSFGFLGWFRNTQRLALTDLEAAAEAAGMTPGEAVPDYLPPGRRYEVGVDRPFTIILNEDKNFSQFAVTGVTASHCLHRGPDTFAALVTSIAQRSDAILVRSFFPQLAYMVREEELGGEVDFLDWYQYWGPTIVARWGVERLRQGPFHRVEALPNGACAIWMGADPFDGGDRRSVKAVVEYLGIHLRVPPWHSTRPSSSRDYAVGVDSSFNVRVNAAEKFDGLSESAQYLLVATADVAGETVAKQLAQRYTQQQLDAIAAAIKHNVSDVRFSDAVIGRVGQLMAHPDVPLHTPAQAEGLAKIIAKLCK